MFVTKTFGICVVALTLISVSTAIFDCPDGYIKHGTSCYKFHHVQVTWPEAVAFCKAFNSHLLTMETPEEFQYIKQKVNEIESSFSLDGIWIAMSDAIVQGEWMWIDPPSKVAYDGWAPGEPENRSGEDCAAIARHVHYDMVDVFCGDRHQYHAICEIDLENTVELGTIVG